MRALVGIALIGCATRRYDSYTLTGNNRLGSAMGYVYAIGCNADSTLLWSVADTSGTIYGTVHRPRVGPGCRGVGRG